MNDLLDALHALIPDIPGLTRFVESTPPDSASPPWLIVTTTIGVDGATLPRLPLAHTAVVEARIAALTPTQANIAALTLLDSVTGRMPAVEGVRFGAAVLASDSGTYLAGTDTTPVPTVQTGGLWNVRVIRWRVDWSR